MNVVTGKDISMIVQGPIEGTANDAPEARRTQRLLQSVRYHLPDAELIVSTWKGSCQTGLDCDKWIESDDPGGISYRDLSNTSKNNVNRQIISVQQGLLQATRPCAFKIRSDMLLTGVGFLDYFTRYQGRNEEWAFLRDRVLTSAFFSLHVNRLGGMPFHPSDWIAFGWSDDLRDMWNIAHCSEEDANRYTPEQYLWLSFLRKHRPVLCEHHTDESNDANLNTWISFANNLVILDPAQLGVQFIKYKISPYTPLVYTHGDWLRLYKRYGGGGAVRLKLDPMGLLKAVLEPASHLRKRLKDFRRSQAGKFAPENKHEYRAFRNKNSQNAVRAANFKRYRVRFAGELGRSLAAQSISGGGDGPPRPKSKVSVCWSAN